MFATMIELILRNLSAATSIMSALDVVTAPAMVKPLMW